MTATRMETFRLTDDQFVRISDFVKAACGINLHEGKKELVKARLSRRLRELGIRDVEEYLGLVRDDPTGGERTGLLDRLTTNLTQFFREPRHFDYLAQTALPAAIARNAATQRLRLWSAGCSSGEEPYSMAATVLDVLGPRAGWDVRILATDLSTRVLARARTGVYSLEQLRDIPPSTLGRHFQPDTSQGKECCHVKPALRSLVTFARLNLMNDWPMRGPFDVIFCRNVMIYFDRPTQKRLVRRLADRLARGGVLCIGHSESLAGGDPGLRYVEPSVYERP